TGKLPDERLEYKLVSEAKHGQGIVGTSPQTNTEWTFWSHGDDSGLGFLPLLSLNYKADMNTAGHLIANRSTDLQLNVTEISGVSGYGELEDASLEVSYDEGETWEEVDLVREDGWMAEIK